MELLREDAKIKGGFHRVHAAPDDPIAIDEAASLSLVILGPSVPHVGKGTAKSLATDAVTETLMRCRASQRAFRNTLVFIAADESSLANAREIVSYDEKPGIQAIATTAPDLPPVPGVHATFARDHEYKRNGTVSLLAGIDLLTGQSPRQGSPPQSRIHRISQASRRRLSSPYRDQADPR